jgi:hypothetical protein
MSNQAWEGKAVHPTPWQKALGWLTLLWALPLSAQSLSPDVDGHTGLWGFRNDAQEWIIAPGYHRVAPFAEGVAVVTVDEEKYISPDGAVYPPMHRVQNTRSWRPQHLVDTSGKVLWSLPTGYQVPTGARFGAGLLPVQAPNGRFGYLDRRGRVVHPFRWRRAWCFAQGWAAIQVPAEQLDSLYFMLPKHLQDRFDRELRLWRQRKDLGPLRRDYPQGGLDVVFIDATGKVQAGLPADYVPPSQEEPFRFEEGFLPVMALPGQSLGLLDQDFYEALPCRFEQLGLMQEGCVFAINRPDLLPASTPDWQGELRPGDTLFVGYLNPAGRPVFSLSQAFLEGNCRYRIEGLPMRRGQALMWLHPLYCEQRIGLRIDRQGALIEYFELEVR